jgi:hypothetical protein
MKTFYRNVAAVSVVVLLSACGTSKSDRMLSGAGLGAGTGAAAAALTGGNVGTGALIGGAGGAAVGGLTNSRDLDLGKPVWR